MARLFIAVPISLEVVGCLKRIMNKLKPRFPQARWADPVHSHLTLAFLGNVIIERTSELGLAMAQAIRGCRPFDLKFQGIGTFGPVQNPRVMWLGVSQGAEPLCRLQGTLASQLTGMHFSLEERDFHPHLTLCRLKSASSELGSLDFARTIADSAEMRAEYISLFESRLTSEGANYSELRRCQFKAIASKRALDS